MLVVALVVMDVFDVERVSYVAFGSETVETVCPQSLVGGRMMISDAAS